MILAEFGKQKNLNSEKIFAKFLCSDDVRNPTVLIPQLKFPDLKDIPTDVDVSSDDRENKTSVRPHLHTWVPRGNYSHKRL